MQLILKTALSLVDLGNNLIYHLLGRQLDSNDIKTLNSLFSQTYESTSWKEQLSKITSGKDLLLVRNEQNYNLIQYCLMNENKFDLLKYLLEYGCDANRGGSAKAINEITNNCNCNHNKIFYDHAYICNCNTNSHQLLSKENECDQPLLLACVFYNLYNLNHLNEDKIKRISTTSVSNVVKNDKQKLSSKSSVSIDSRRRHSSGIDTLKTKTSSRLSSSSSSSSSSDSDNPTHELNDCEDYIDIDEDLYYEKYTYQYEYDCSSSSNEKYEKSNEFHNENVKTLKEKRLNLVNLLLKHGADKTQHSYLSFTSLHKLNLKSRMKLGLFTRLNNLSVITPLQATICFDDLELLKALFNYDRHLLKSKIDIYELVKYSVRMNSKNCLGFLLNHAFNVIKITQITLENIRDSKVLSMVQLNEHSSTLLLEFCTQNKSLRQDLSQFMGNKCLYNIINKLLVDYKQTESLQVSMQTLFKSENLMDTLFFYDFSNEQTSMFHQEFKDILQLFGKNGAKLDDTFECLFANLIQRAKLNSTCLFQTEYLNQVLLAMLKYGNLPSNGIILHKLFDLMQVINIDEYEPLVKLVDLIAKLEAPIDNLLDGHQLSKFMHNFLFKQNFLNSNQSKKLEFFKTLLKILFKNGYNLNSTCVKYVSGGYLSTNNLLNNLISFVFHAKTGYQLTCLYEFVLLSLQFGANPNIEPFKLDPKVTNLNGSLVKLKRSSHFLTQLCTQFSCEMNLSKFKNETFVEGCCCCVKNSNIILLNEYYCRFIKLFHDNMDQNVLNKCMRFSISLESTPNGLVDYLQLLHTSPRSLQSICRRSIIRNIDKPYHESCHKLPINSKLKDFILQTNQI